MSFWATPVGIILPIVLQPLLIAIYRFFIIKKPLPAKKAKLISTVYTVVTFAFIGIISNGDAFFVGLAYFFLWFPNYFLLAGKRNSFREQVFLKRFILRKVCPALLFLILPYIAKISAILAGLIFVSIIPICFFIAFKDREFENNVESYERWQEKLEREQLEREQKEKEIKEKHSDS